MDTQTTEAASNDSNIPFFSYASPKSKYNCWHIDVKDEIFHYIVDPSEFFDALGYKSNLNIGMLPDEFVWERYIREKAIMSPHCIQMQICVYLQKHSLAFKMSYGSAIGDLEKKCISSYLGDSDKYCLQCPTHPRCCISNFASQ